MADNIVETPSATPRTAHEEDLHEFAGGWIKERKGTEPTGFLKATYIVVALSAIVYSIIWWDGDTGGDRGKLVQQFNSETMASRGFMWVVTLLVVIFAIVLWKYAFTKSKPE